MKLLVLILLMGAIYAGLSLPVFNIAKYEVEGNRYYSADEILIMGNCKTGGNIFWKAGISDIEERLSKDAYMQEVTVKRSLPDTIVIEIVERKQTAAIALGEKYVVIDSNGTVLRKTSVEPKIPVLRGLTITKMTVGEEIETEEKILLQQTLEMLASMEKGDMFFKKVEISKLQIKAYVYDSLLCQGTPENLTKAIESNRLQLVIQELYEKGIERGTIKVTGDEDISFTPKID
ncbi:MAG: FtsQ-type POTRA domain-containing protein [Firmicutes bacterium]|nr:FtsQ-type POTRA domain-containing protein [Bacillota bacterium]